MKIACISLGCPKNQVDLDVMVHILLSAGHETVADLAEADVILVNTCGFIESAKTEAIENILEACSYKQQNPELKVIVTGCLAERYRSQIEEEIPEVDAVVGCASNKAIDTIVARLFHGEDHLESYGAKKDFPLGGKRVIGTPAHYAYLKIAEGCNNRCTYCAIPLIRGKMRSRTMKDIIEEATSLDALGVKELNIIAQDPSAYGIDLYGKYELPELIRGICDATNIPWIRLLYCYPDKITDELVAEIRDNPRVVKYIDIPIQHISDRVLKAMNRHGDSAMIRDAVKRLRDIPGIVLRSTAIVGFPGETEEDFEELCKFIKEAKFERFGAFTYSREEDTPAYDFPNQVDEQVKQDRYDILMQTQLEISEKFNEKRIGKTYKVMCEGYDPVAGSHYGRSYAEAADIDGKIWFSVKNPNLRIAEGEMIDVKITEAMDYDLVGEAILNI